MQITKSGFKISISATGAISEAFISPGPFASSINFFESSDVLFRAKDFTFNTISVTSSLTPFIDVNSCNTPSIWIEVTAVPLIEDKSILLNELPSVNPYPFSSGSAVIFANALSSLSWISSLAGLINDFQFFEFTSV